MKKTKIIWIIVRIMLVLISILVFTPLVIPMDKYSPELFGLPYLLWVGILVYFALVALIFIGVRVHSKILKEE